MKGREGKEGRSNAREGKGGGKNGGRINDKK